MDKNTWNPQKFEPHRNYQLIQSLVSSDCIIRGYIVSNTAKIFKDFSYSLKLLKFVHWFQSQLFILCTLYNCAVVYVIESHIGVSWKLKNEIPNAHILDQVCLSHTCTYVCCYMVYSLVHYVGKPTMFACI